jgi:GT2 family glycosyltransferase
MHEAVTDQMTNPLRGTVADLGVVWRTECAGAADEASGADPRGAATVGGEIKPFPGWSIKSSLPGALQDCSLVLATYKRPKEIGRLIQSLLSIPDPPGEVVVVDGSPGTESEAELLALTRSASLPFDLFYLRSTAGLTRQRNVGIDTSSKEYVFFLDDDCVPEPQYFREIRQVFVTDKVGKVGAVTGLMINLLNDQLSLRWRLRLAIRLVPQIEPGRYYPSGTCIPKKLVGPFSGVRRIDALDGCSMAFRRTVLDKHRFSEFFTGYSQGEDLEISLRIQPEWQILWCGDAHVNHFHASGGRPTSLSKGLMEVRNRYFIWKRHSGNITFIERLRFWLDFPFLIAMDLGMVIVRPRQIYWLSHAMGIAWGILGCIIDPPRFEEPPPRQQYCLDLVALPEQ